MSGIVDTCWKFQFGDYDREDMDTGYTSNGLNEELVKSARGFFDDEEIDLEEYEERLDAYLTTECPPDKMHIEDIGSFDRERFIHFKEEMQFFGVPYKREGMWYYKQDND